MQIEPIGLFHCAEKHPYEAARQATLAQDNAGKIVLREGHNFEQALQDLPSFSHIWILFQFHHNTDWKPLVQPPRGRRKVGLFASRAPYRPNPIGLSCVRLLSVKGRTVHVADHDLLDGTPILDIKPYVPYADSIPTANAGWLEDVEEDVWQIEFTDVAREKLTWLERNDVDCIGAFLTQQLVVEPFNRKRKRLKRLGEYEWEIAYRTWRVHFVAAHEQSLISIDNIASGYSESDLADLADPYEDKGVHREFLARFQ